MVDIPVICIDGPSASGKGTISKKLANKLKWHFLDSGSLYRLAALSILNNQVDIENIAEVLNHIQNMQIKFEFDSNNTVKIFLNNADVTNKIRQEAVGEKASQLAVISAVRNALLQKQRDFRKIPGLVADGRDMGTVVFEDAALKFYLDASSEVRAQRRQKQLRDMGICVSMDSLLAQINERDKRDSTRDVAPLKIAADAIVIDTSNLNVDDVLAKVWDEVEKL